ncbi:MAG: hypothetical protein GY750_01270 [Lentisphaerae bacterium]|nr:hypothetical protein [Lentisphaerota bacterium]MCP4100049.1 hypothetical protein [Lentisphaerota bacterium]
MRRFFPGTAKLLAILMLVITIGTYSTPSHASAPQKTDYPHWNFHDKSAYKKLKRINSFIEKNKDKQVIAVFDWDGTLFYERLSEPEMGGEYPGQPAFYLWMLKNASTLSFKPFPMQDTVDNKFKENIISFTRYIEGRTNVPWQGYPTFIANSLVLAGMTPENIIEGVQQFLDSQETKHLFYFPMLDVLQKFVDSGIEVWIITGSNQYFVAAIIKYIEDNFKYSSDRNYNFAISSSPYDSATGHIAGNSLKRLKNGKFSNFYDDMYVRSPDGKLYIVNETGKLIVMRNLENCTGKTIEFAAGNSGGDYSMINYVAKQPAGLCIAVETRGKLRELLPKYPHTIIELTTEEVMYQKSTLYTSAHSDQTR